MEKYTAIQMDNEGKTYGAFHAVEKDMANMLLKDWAKPGYLDKKVTIIHIFVNGVYRPELTIKKATIL